jgi:hypothetical protein
VKLEQFSRLALLKTVRDVCLRFFQRINLRDFRQVAFQVIVIALNQFQPCASVLECRALKFEIGCDLQYAPHGSSLACHTNTVQHANM